MAPTQIRHTRRPSNMPKASNRRNYRGKHEPYKRKDDLCERRNAEPITSFDAMNLKPDLLKGIFAYGFEKPSTIQQRAICPILQGRDVIAQSQSGTGKVCTFALYLVKILGGRTGSFTLYFNFRLLSFASLHYNLSIPTNLQSRLYCLVLLENLQNRRTR